MQFFNARSNSQGFTVLETLIILLIIGTLSALVAPSFLSLLNKTKVNNAVAQVQGALQEAHRETIRRSKSCDVTIDTTINKVTGSCLVTGVRTLPKDITMTTNVIGSIQFGFRGNTKFTLAPSSGETGTIILYSSTDPIPDKKCIAISNGIGIIRSGSYKIINGISTCNQISQ